MPHEAFLTRFAPSPTGPLHLGHAFSALTAHDRAQARDGTMLLRIEDIDQARCRPEYERAIFDDLRWIGINWPEPVMRQSDRLPAYRAALDRLVTLGLCYPCRCRRSDIRAALSAPQETALHYGPDGLIYPGTCRDRPMADIAPDDAIRLDMRRAVEHVAHLASDLPLMIENGPLHEGRYRLDPEALIAGTGDIVLARRDIGTSYHVAVVVDDAAQAVSEVVRGADLFSATMLHVLLQVLLELPVPEYYHHRIIRDEEGVRLAKRDNARAIANYRAEGVTPQDLRRMVGLGPG